MAKLEELQQALTGTPEFTEREYMSLARLVKGTTGLELKSLKVGFLASFTIELIEPKLVVESARQGVRIENYYAPFNQFEQQVIPPDSGLYQFHADIIVVAFCLDDIPLLKCMLTSDVSQRETAVMGMTERMRQIVDAIRENTEVPIILWNFPKRRYAASGLADRSSLNSEVSFFEQINHLVSDLGRSHNDIYVFDIDCLSAEFGLKTFYDTRLQFLARMPFSACGQAAIARRLTRYFRAIIDPPKKCLVLDLDNTLWGGVVGEAGLSGIQLGQDYPGSAFVCFHYYVRSLKNRGVLLALASKNNYEDAVEVFQKHPDCILSMDDFADAQINWGDKVESLKKIATNLNIGTDGLVFFDDNPVEREWVASQMPEVKVLDFPASPDMFPGAIEDSGIFDRLVLTDEDSERSGFYQAEKKRREFRNKSDSLDDFLHNLETKIQVENITPESSSFDRLVQLLKRTNQFNLTTRRHGEANLMSMLNNGAVALIIRVSDRFGEHGIVGLSIALVEPGKNLRWRIDTFLLSCRVMGRGIENALLSVTIDQIKGRGAVDKVIGEYIETKKNLPAKDFYEKQGFKRIESSNGLHFEFDPNTQVIDAPNYFQIEVN